MSHCSKNSEETFHLQAKAGWSFMKRVFEEHNRVDF